MKFSTSLIERESQKLYLRYIKDPKIPDDLCLDIYEEFMKTLGLERAKGRKSINGNFIGQMARFATRTVFNRNKLREDKEEVLTEIVNRNASQFWCQSKSKEEKAFMRKIALFLKDFSKTKDHHPLYLRVFLLRNAFHITDETLDVLEMSTDLKPSLLSKQLETMKEKIRRDVNEKLQEEMV